MNNNKAKKLTARIFQLICDSDSIEDLIAIGQNEFEEKYKMDEGSYPKIDFEIKPSDLSELKNKGILNSDFSFKNNISGKITDPLARLLYSLAWKNGDLKKLKHIAKGINDFELENIDQDEALVFYQFGKYLTKTEGQPIIDQHVIRAFAIYITNDLEIIERSRKLNAITKKDKENIRKYIDWLKSDQLSMKLKSLNDYTYYIDKILFATGKKIKLRK